MKCEDEATLPIDVGWPKKKHQEKQLKNGGKRSFLYTFWLGCGLVPALFSQFTFSHFTPPFILERPSRAFF